MRGPEGAPDDAAKAWDTGRAAPPPQSREDAWAEAQHLAAEALDLDLLADKNSYRPKP